MEEVKKNEKTKSYVLMRLEGIMLLFVIAILLFVAALGYCFVLSRKLDNANGNVELLKEQNSVLVQEKDELEAKNEELQEKVLVLSDTVNDKMHQEEKQKALAAQEYVPTGFPLKGTASYNKEKTELEENPIATFSASKGTSVIPTAKGTVYSIAGSEENGYIVMIDHGNGYFTVYRNGAEPKVRQGDEVTVATMIFDIEEKHEELGYQIIHNNAYIDPLGLMEAYG